MNSSVGLLESNEFYRRQLEEEIEGLNNRVQELERENLDLRNENKNLKRLLKSNSFPVANDHNSVHETQEKRSEIQVLLNKTQQSNDKRNTHPLNNTEINAQEFGN
jgi:regulator of replication initiation timing